jgi:hypothetical protein
VANLKNRRIQQINGFSSLARQAEKYDFLQENHDEMRYRALWKDGPACRLNPKTKVQRPLYNKLWATKLSGLCNCLELHLSWAGLLCLGWLSTSLPATINQEARFRIFPSYSCPVGDARPLSYQWFL